MKRSILTKLLIGIILPIILVFVLSAGIILAQVRSSITGTTTNELTARSEAAANQISEFFTRYMEATRQMGANVELEKLLKETTPGKKITLASGFADFKRTMENICALDPQTIAVSWIADVDSSQCAESSGWVSDIGDWDITTRSWFGPVQQGGQTFITEPYENSSTGAYVSSVITPVLDSSTGELLGVAALDISVDALGEMMAEYRLGDTGFFVLSTEGGLIIYHPDGGLKGKAVGEADFSDGLVQALESHQAGSQTYTSNGNVCYGYLSEVGDTGWQVLTGLPEKEFFAAYAGARNALMAMFGGGLLIILILVVLIARGVTRPIKQLMGTANRIADGDLDVQMDLKSRDETGQLAASINRTVTRLKDYILYIEEITSTLQQIGQGNLDYEMSLDYRGEFQKVKDALEEVARTLSAALNQIGMAADQVSSSSDQVAAGAQALSQGTTEQASAVEELAATIMEISNKVEESARSAQETRSEVEKAGSMAEESNRKMKEMIAAMEDINSRSGEIGKIVKSIEDISFQTNILALNAAVEAARAGVAGKGFAVVADEVRNLAGKSAEAAKNTTALIEDTVRAVNRGADLVNQTADSLFSVVGAVENSASMTDKIAADSREQAQAISQVTTGVDQIASVVQTNSATAEESAAASEQLAGQAQMLKSLLARFRVKKGVD